MEVFLAGTGIISYVFYGDFDLVLSFDASMAVDCDSSVGLADQVFSNFVDRSDWVASSTWLEKSEDSCDKRAEISA